MKHAHKPPIVWTVGGSDPSGGAGIQVDLKVINAFGAHGCSAITALTAQNTLTVQSIKPTPTTDFKAQLNLLWEDLPPATIKMGMLGSLDICRVLADFLKEAPSIPVVCDPVLQSSSGTPLLAPEALGFFIENMLPNVTVLTPNLPEAQLLTGHTSQLKPDELATALLKLGPASILVKGGHSSQEICTDIWSDGRQVLQLSSPRIETPSTHGTGCILSTAIASAIAFGASIPDAISQAKTYMNQCLRAPSRLGKGAGPMIITAPTHRAENLPSVCTKI